MAFNVFYQVRTYTRYISHSGALFGWQKIGAIVNLGSYYFVGIPRAVLMAFVLHIGGKVTVTTYCLRYPSVHITFLHYFNVMKILSNITFYFHLQTGFIVGYYLCTSSTSVMSSVYHPTRKLGRRSKQLPQYDECYLRLFSFPIYSWWVFVVYLGNEGSKESGRNNITGGDSVLINVHLLYTIEITKEKIFTCYVAYLISCLDGCQPSCCIVSYY